MGFLSFLFGASDSTRGSYCKNNTHYDYLEDEEIDDEINSAEDRGDTVEFSEKDFHNRCVVSRHDEDGKSPVQGPKQAWWNR